MAKLLLIEDDALVAQVVKCALEALKHHVDLSDDGAVGFDWLMHERYDAAIVDWQLPNMSGPTICREFRRLGGVTPILMITGRDKTKDLVEGLESGADDFISKPFELEEMHARLKSLLRRGPQFDATVLQCGVLELNTAERTVTAGGQRVMLNRKELAILELLMRYPGSVFNGNAILERVWPSDSESSPEVIRSHIARLRSRLAEVCPAAGEAIKSIYGQGYKLEF